MGQGKVYGGCDWGQDKLIALADEGAIRIYQMNLEKVKRRLVLESTPLTFSFYGFAISDQQLETVMRTEG